MEKLKKMRIWLPTVLVVALASVLLISANSAFATCSVLSGNNGHWWGGYKKDENFSGSTMGVKAELDNYNPAPVFRDVSYWVMLDDSSDHYAQVGWGKDSNDQVEYVFSEFIGLSGWERYYYDAQQDKWVGSKSTQPSSNEKYQVVWIEGSPYEQIQLQYDNSTTQNISVTWTPDDWDVMGEVQNYELVVGDDDKGDHSPGDTTNKIHADNIKVYGVNGQGSWQDPSGYETWEQANMDTDTSASGVGFRIWDVRCSE